MYPPTPPPPEVGHNPFDNASFPLGGKFGRDGTGGSCRFNVLCLRSSHVDFFCIHIPTVDGNPKQPPGMSKSL